MIMIMVITIRRITRRGGGGGRRVKFTRRGGGAGHRPGVSKEFSLFLEDRGLFLEECSFLVFF